MQRATPGSRDSETIFALSSGALPAGVAVVRVSGGLAGGAVRRLFGRLPAPRQASYGAIAVDGGTIIDRGLILWFPGPASFTGEDCAEFHLHGGPAVVRALAEALQAIPQVRPAEAGEFSRRAFLNGKLDLTEIEGLADLIAAETEGQRRLALRQASGGTRAILDALRARLIRMRALIEAELDFPDEEDVPGSVASEVWREAAALATEIRAHLASTRGERLRSGLEVVLMGPPNAGKSSLLNVLVGREAAIVTPEAGTTRDLIEVRMDLGGYPVSLIDTAGLREAGGPIEAEGIRRALARGGAADLVLWLLPPDGVSGPPPVSAGVDIWRVATKADLGGSAVGADFEVSAVTGAGLDALELALGRFAAERLGGREDAVITRARHREGLELALCHLERAIAGDGLGLELRAEDLRAAADAIGRVTGRIDVEDLLDVIFGEFCIGK